MATQNITFTEWTPDQPEIVQNLSDAKNVIPASVGYIPLPKSEDLVLGTSAPENLNSLVAGKFNTTARIFAGGSTKLFAFDSADGSYDNVSKSVARTIASASLYLNIAYIVTAAPHGYSVGDSVDVTATFSPADTTFNGTFTITSIVNPTQFTYAKSYSTEVTITNVELSSNVATITTSAAHGYTTGDSVTVDATITANPTNNVFDGNYVIASTPTTNTFTYAKVASGVTSTPATGSVYKGIASKSPTSSSITTGEYTAISKWDFAQFGNTILAANDKNKIQSYTLGASQYFGDVSPDAPIARYVTVVRDFVVSANLNSGVDSATVAWSDINDESDWSVGGASQADTQIVVDGGNIQGLTGGEFGLVLLDRAIVRMTYIGSPFFFQFDTISRGVGCIEGNSVVQYANTTYFLSDDGFYSCDGSTVRPIGTQKIDRWFFANADPSKFNLMSAAADPVKKIIVWDFVNIFGGNSLLIYNWQIDKWSYGDTDVNYLSAVASAGTTLEGLDSVYEDDANTMTNGKPYTITDLGTGVNWVAMGAVGAVVGARVNKNSTAYSGTGGKVIDLTASRAAGRAMDNTDGTPNLTTSLDSGLWSGGKLLFAGIVENKIVTFTGQPSPAQINTGLIGSQYPSVVTLARPLVDNGSADVSIVSQVRLNQVIDFSTYTSADSENRVSLRSAGKYHKLSVIPTGDNWSNIIGIDIEVQQQGVR